MNSTDHVNEFYDGSLVLKPLTEITGLPIDQINFLASQFFALFVGYFYREYLGPHKATATQRHLVQILIGIPLTYFCFGRQIIHLVIQSIVCLVLMRCLEPGIMEKAVLAAAMAYLCICHTYRIIYDYGGYTLDITGPLMLNTQRLSSLAFSLRDGRQTDQTKLTKTMQEKAVRYFPSTLELTSYIFSFHGLMCGPFCFYKDYISFIEGTNFKHKNNTANNHCNNTNQQHELAPNNATTYVTTNNATTTNNTTNNVTPSNTNGGGKLAIPPVPGKALQQKMLTALVFGISTIWILPKFPKTIITGPEFSEHGFFYKMFLIQLYAALQRQKYYFAWKLGESVNACAGLGYNGLDERGVARWDLIDNADIYKVEFSTSLKELLDNWNRSTTYWLRYIIYDRIHSTLIVFFFSAFWHGFYAGYYITFCTGGILIHTARQMRRNVRPLFQANAATIFIYDTITFISTRIAIAYLGFPFLILEFGPVFTIYRNVYFWMHIAAVILAVGVIGIKRMLKSKSQ